MPYTKQELKNELLRCYKENGNVSTEILNSTKTDYPTQMTYYNHFGSLKNAKESVGIISGHTRERVLSDIRTCYEKYEEVSTDTLNNDDELVNYQTVYDHFNSISKAVEESGINWEDAKCDVTYNEPEYSEEELIENLMNCKDEQGNTKTTTVNDFGGPTATVYRDRFGSLTEARKIAGIDESFKGGSNGKIHRLLHSVEVDEDSDALIYVLKILVNGEEAYYVGETTNIYSRLQSHVYRTNIQTWANGPYGKILSPREKANEMNEISVESIEYTVPLYQDSDESDIEFRRRRKYKEHHEHLSLAIDKNTLEVYGGR